MPTFHINIKPNAIRIWFPLTLIMDRNLCDNDYSNWTRITCLEKIAIEIIYGIKALTILW